MSLSHSCKVSREADPKATLPEHVMEVVSEVDSPEVLEEEVPSDE
jgi:hypothetical protein